MHGTKSRENQGVAIKSLIVESHRMCLISPAKKKKKKDNMCEMSTRKSLTDSVPEAFTGDWSHMRAHRLLQGTYSNSWLSELKESRVSA